MMNRSSQATWRLVLRALLPCLLLASQNAAAQTSALPAATPSQEKPQQSTADHSKFHQRQYIPSLDQMSTVILHYSYGIFLGRPHPYKVVPERKHNPLQRLAYLWLKLMINPLIWASGLAYLFYANWRDLAPTWLGLQEVALAHTLGAFMMLVFFIAHVYLTTTGHTPLAHIKAMITGWDDKD